MGWERRRHRLRGPLCPGACARTMFSHHPDHLSFFKDGPLPLTLECPKALSDAGLRARGEASTRPR